MPYEIEMENIQTYFAMGGFVMWPLLIVAMWLWYGLIWRMQTVRPSKRDPRVLLEHAKKNQLVSKSVTAKAAKIAYEMSSGINSRSELKQQLKEKFFEIKRELNGYRSTVRSLVAVAPLMGLLGTVDGMIETFNALGEMALFTQTGGIAGGISRALFTTQMGLAISIPGIMLGRVIERRQMHINRELDQILDQVCSEKN